MGRNLQSNYGNQGEKNKKTGEKSSMITEKEFLFLDTNLLWSRNGKLSFRAYSKPVQKVVYVEKGSTHRRLYLRVILSGVFKRRRRQFKNSNKQN